MSRERDKLIAILNELEKDYHAGNISQEKYASLRERYIHKINTIDTSNRVRNMRTQYNHVNRNPKRNYPPNSYNSKRNNPRYNKHPQRNRGPDYRNSNYGNSRPKGYYDENGEFHYYKSRPSDNRYLNDSYKTRMDDDPKKTKSKTSVALIALFTVILLFAFGAGIFMGFGDGLSIGGFSDLLGTGASINDTAFPILEQNISSVDYSSSSSSSNYSSSSADYSSYSSSSSTSGSGGDGSGSGSTSGSGGDGSGSSGSGSSESGSSQVT